MTRGTSSQVRERNAWLRPKATPVSRRSTGHLSAALSLGQGEDGYNFLTGTGSRDHGRSEALKSHGDFKSSPGATRWLYAKATCSWGRRWGRWWGGISQGGWLRWSTPTTAMFGTLKKLTRCCSLEGGLWLVTVTAVLVAIASSGHSSSTTHPSFIVRCTNLIALGTLTCGVTGWPGAAMVSWALTRRWSPSTPGASVPLMPVQWLLISGRSRRNRWVITRGRLNLSSIPRFVVRPEGCRMSSMSSGSSPRRCATLSTRWQRVRRLTISGGFSGKWVFEEPMCASASRTSRSQEKRSTRTRPSGGFGKRCWATSGPQSSISTCWRSPQCWPSFGVGWGASTIWTPGSWMWWIAWWPTLHWPRAGREAKGWTEPCGVWWHWTWQANRCWSPYGRWANGTTPMWRLVGLKSDAKASSPQIQGDHTENCQCLPQGNPQILPISFLWGGGPAHWCIASWCHFGWIYQLPLSAGRQSHPSRMAFEWHEEIFASPSLPAADSPAVLPKLAERPCSFACHSNAVAGGKGFCGGSVAEPSLWLGPPASLVLCFLSAYYRVLDLASWKYRGGQPLKSNCGHFGEDKNFQAISAIIGAAAQGSGQNCGKSPYSASSEGPNLAVSTTGFSWKFHPFGQSFSPSGACFFSLQLAPRWCYSHLCMLPWPSLCCLTGPLAGPPHCQNLFGWCESYLGQTGFYPTHFPPPSSNGLLLGFFQIAPPRGIDWVRLGLGYGVPGFTAAAEASSACGQVRPVRGQGRSCAGVSMSDVSGAPNLDQQHGCAWKIAGRAVLGWIE